MHPCSLCQSPVATEAGGPYVRCDACSAIQYLAGDVLVPYYRLRPGVTLIEAEQAMRVWMAETARPAGLDGVVELGDARAWDHLFWTFQVFGDDGTEYLALVPAVNTPLPELREVWLQPVSLDLLAMAGDPWDEVVQPYVELPAAWKRLGMPQPLEQIRSGVARVPLYEFPYRFNGRGYRVIVEGLTGQCLVHRFPRRTGMMHGVMLGVAAAVFAAEGVVLGGGGWWLTASFITAGLAAGWLTLSFLKARPPGPR